MIDRIPLPITFNPYKHHFCFLKEQIQNLHKQKLKVVVPDILTIANNLLDLYLGELSIEAICNECLKYLIRQKVIEKSTFLEWLKPTGYKKLELSDKSIWIIKEATDAERYIHIHPAKNSNCTIRVRGTTLKTVAALMILNHSQGENLMTLHEVNRIRYEYLKLSPVKSIQLGKGISRMWQLFNS